MSLNIRIFLSCAFVALFSLTLSRIIDSHDKVVIKYDNSTPTGFVLQCVAGAAAINAELDGDMLPELADKIGQLCRNPHPAFLTQYNNANGVKKKGAACLWGMMAYLTNMPNGEEFSRNEPLIQSALIQCFQLEVKKKGASK